MRQPSFLIKFNSWDLAFSYKANSIYFIYKVLVALEITHK